MKNTLHFLSNLKSIAIIGAIGGTMLWFVISKFKNSQEKSITSYNSIDDLKKNGSKWVNIKTCSLDLLTSSYVEASSNEKIKEIFIPIKMKGNNYSNTFFLHTKELGLVSIFDKYMILEQKITGLKMQLEMSKNDSNYLKFMKSSPAELEKKLENLEVEHNKYVLKNNAIKKSITGMLDLEFEISDYNRMKLGGGDIHIIKHNAFPDKGLYMWFLLIVGPLLIIFCLLNFIGLLFKDKTK